MQIYTFWEPRDRMPYYIQLCIETWKKFLPEAEITILYFSNVKNYIDIDIYGKNLLSGKFSFMLISDAVRIALIEKIGGIWLDADTILLNKSARKYFLREYNYQISFWGNPKTKRHFTCYINSVAHSECMRLWLDFVKKQIRNLTPQIEVTWDYVLGNIMNDYSKTHPEEVKTIDSQQNLPENWTLSEEVLKSPRQEDINKRIAAFQNYYFRQQKHIEDVPTDMLILHNSWVPPVFKNFSKEEFLRCNSTMSNILMATLDMKRDPTKSLITFA